MDRAQGNGSPRAEALARPAAAAAPDRGAELLASVEAALAASFSARATDALIAPLREALAKPAAERDPDKLAPAFERIEDVLEAASVGAARTQG